jgi:hypothetical protein
MVIKRKSNALFLDYPEEICIEASEELAASIYRKSKLLFWTSVKEVLIYFAEELVSSILRVTYPEAVAATSPKSR